ncbi:hypothetical protein FNF29_02525 [Cafeteria roenbergensis]|uniref:RING-type domain-containing protein n=1 Tax=Cafeteria roenbergensis TaxID=33653 RepID=A0A5A8CML8_CAFRO|nr:hypothetical protein FNF29_02525 [Cafeteria roenbergensis]|eukprot:KAA0154305.1 hypothetical protein FNF29_02525 [Cafeteria roenbergensis]
MADQHAADGVCMICISSMRLGSGLAVSTACGTVFHKECLAAWESASKRQRRELACPHCKSPTQCLGLRVSTDSGKPHTNQAGLPLFVREMIERLDGALATAAAAEADAKAVAEESRESLVQQAAELDARVRVREEEAIRAKLEAEEALMRARQAEGRASSERSAALKERETHERATREIALRLQRANAMVRAGKAIETENARHFTSGRDPADLSRQELEAALWSATGAFERASAKAKRAESQLRIKARAEERASAAEAKRRELEWRPEPAKRRRSRCSRT